jgi:hypothetical protein
LTLSSVNAGGPYDNGGRYQYAGPTAGTVLLRQAPNRVAVVRFDGLKSTELWSGHVSTEEEFDEMMNAVAANVTR